jgi:hypothetical protein
VGDLEEPDGHFGTIASPDNESLPVPAHAGALVQHVEGTGVVAGGSQTPHLVEGHVTKKVGLVRETDADQGTAGALGAVHQWWGRDGVRGHLAELGYHLKGSRHQGVVEGDYVTRPCLGVIEDAFIAAVPVFPQDEPLSAELNPFGLPGPVGPWGSLLVVDGSDAPAFAFEEVELGDQAEPGCRE